MEDNRIPHRVLHCYIIGNRTAEAEGKEKHGWIMKKKIYERII